MSTTFDESPIALDQRLKDPDTLKALNGLLDRAGEIDSLIQKIDSLQTMATNLVAMGTDIFDEWARNLNDDGIDLETSVKQGIHALLWLGQRVSEVELERLGILLRSDVLDENSLEAVGMAGAALARSQKENCVASTPNRVGLFGLLKAMSDPDMQRSLAFAVRFAECFGKGLAHRPSENGAPK